MTLQNCTPNMMVEDVDRTVAFYREVLGFEVVMTVPDEGPFDWAMVRRDGVELMFQSRASLAAEYPELEARTAGGALTLYLDVKDAAGLYERLRDRVAVVKESHTTFYGKREFAIRDTDGFILTFAEDAP